MNVVDEMLAGTAGEGLLNALMSPYATVLMWVVPIMMEIAFVWAVVHLWRNRRRLRGRRGMPGEPAARPGAAPLKAARGRPR